VPADFILPAESSGGSQWQQQLAIANCLAQAEGLMDGFEPNADEPYRRHPGNRPSNMILLPRVSPNTLGQLIALYEHKVFVESTIWGINAFDQFGVELGKKLATDLLPAVRGLGEYAGRNESTKRIIDRLVSMSNRQTVDQ
jgi:glucose-6-phosphate isomerase